MVEPTDTPDEASPDEVLVETDPNADIREEIEAKRAAIEEAKYGKAQTEAEANLAYERAALMKESARLDQELAMHQAQAAHAVNARGPLDTADASVASEGEPLSVRRRRVQEAPMVPPADETAAAEIVNTDTNNGAGA